jgi:hypothetical protein
MSALKELVTQKRRQLEQQSGRRARTVKATQGKNRFRILPGWRDNGDETFWHDFGQHFVKTESGELRAVYICTARTYGRSCEICDAIARGMSNAHSDGLIKALGEAKAKLRVLVNALHIDGDDPTTPIILELTSTTFEKVLDVMSEYDDMLDPKVGSDIIINRTGAGLNTEYSVVVGRNSKPVPAAALKALPNLDEYVAQEYDEGRNKALSQVAQVSGLMPAAALSSPHVVNAPAADLDDILDEDTEVEEPTRATATNGAAQDDEPARTRNPAAPLPAAEPIPSDDVDGLEALLADLPA